MITFAGSYVEKMLLYRSYQQRRNLNKSFWSDSNVIETDTLPIVFWYFRYIFSHFSANICQHFLQCIGIMIEIAARCIFNDIWHIIHSRFTIHVVISVVIQCGLALQNLVVTFTSIFSSRTSAGVTYETQRDALNRLRNNKETKAAFGWRCKSIFNLRLWNRTPWMVHRGLTGSQACSRLHETTTNVILRH